MNENSSQGKKITSFLLIIILLNPSSNFFDLGYCNEFFFYQVKKGDQRTYRYTKVTLNTINTYQEIHLCLDNYNSITINVTRGTEFIISVIDVKKEAVFIQEEINGYKTAVFEDCSFIDQITQNRLYYEETARKYDFFYF